MRVRKLAGIFISIVIIILIVVFVFLVRKSSYGKTGEKAKRLNISAEVTPISNSSLVLWENGIIVEGEGTNIKARDIDGRSLWSLQLEVKIKDILSCGNDVLVVTEKNNIIVLNETGKRIWQYDMALSPSAIIPDVSKHFVIQYNWKEHNTFEIFNTEGEKVCSGILDKAQILSFSTSSGKLFTLSLLDTSSDAVSSKVVTYDTKSEILWASNFDTVLVPKIVYSSKDEVVIIGESFIKKYNSKGILVKEVEITDDLSNVAASKSLFVVVTKKGGYYEIYTYDGSLNQLGSSAIKSKPEGIFAGKDEYLLYNKDSLTLANKHGRITALYESNYDVNYSYIHEKSVYIISNRKLVKLVH